MNRSFSAPPVRQPVAPSRSSPDKWPRGRVPLKIEVLAPNQRPLQVTDDLGRFWREVYPEIKPALSRRYPRHEWR